MSGSPEGTATDVVRGGGYGSRVGTWGPGAFDNDDALDLLDALSGQDTAARRQVLERVFREARDHPENLNFTFGAAEVVAATAVVAAGLPAGGAVAQEITGHDYDVTALVVPGSEPELADAALAALLIAAGHDGAWHRDWADPGQRRRAAGPQTSSPRSSTAVSTGTIRNYPRSPDGLRHGPPPLMKTTSGRHTRVRRGPIQITQRNPDHAQTGR
jgi:Domain of unknown function (DUF4259)